MPTKVKEEEDAAPGYGIGVVYSTGLACRTCYAEVPRGRADGRCSDCYKDKKVLPVNYRRPPKRKTEEEDEYDYS